MSSILCQVPCGTGSCYRFADSQIPFSPTPESPRWAWAFLNSLLALGRHPRLPVDRAERGYFFTVENAFILQTPPPQGPCPLAFLLGRAALTGLSGAETDTHLHHRKHHQVPVLYPCPPPLPLQATSPGTGGCRPLEQGGEEGDADRSSSFSVHVCFYLGTTCRLPSLRILIQ